jgi:uncharacterized protein (DUF1778 family)
VSADDPGMLIVRRGRPYRAEARSEMVRVSLSPAERARVQVAASTNYQTVSQFMRDALVTAAEDCLEDLGPIS